MDCVWREEHRHTLVMVYETPEHIMKTPGVCGGRARIAGHRVRVHDIVGWSEHQGMTPDEIVSHVPSITLSDVPLRLSVLFRSRRGDSRRDARRPCLCGRDASEVPFHARREITP